MVVHAFHPNPREAETGRSLTLRPGQHSLQRKFQDRLQSYRKILSRETNKQTKNNMGEEYSKYNSVFCVCVCVIVREQNEANQRKVFNIVEHLCLSLELTIAKLWNVPRSSSTDQ